jgi:GT2 family glycosyltransferase
VLIDDGCTDGTAQAVREAYPAVEVIRGPGTWWWAGCLQRGIEWLAAHDVSDSDIVLIANDDTTFDADYVERAVAYLATHERCLLLSRSRDPATGEVHETGVHADFLRFRFEIARGSQQINCLSSRGLFLRWTDVREVGGFHPEILPHYWSDLEYTWRAHRRGMACVTDPSVCLIANPKATGHHNLNDLTGFAFLGRLFSVKTPTNPIYESSFVLLAAPLPLILLTLLRVWLVAAVKIVWQGALGRQRRVRPATHASAHADRRHPGRGQV